MLAGAYRALEQTGANLGRGGVEEHTVVRIAQGRIQIRAPAFEAVRLGQGGDLVRIAPYEDGIGHQAVAVGERYPSLLANFDDGADQMLIHAHAPVTPCMMSPDAMLRHELPPLPS
jgi:hypothetical protein